MEWRDYVRENDHDFYLWLEKRYTKDIHSKYMRTEYNSKEEDIFYALLNAKKLVFLALWLEEE